MSNNLSHNKIQTIREEDNICERSIETEPELSDNRRASFLTASQMLAETSKNSFKGSAVIKQAPQISNDDDGENHHNNFPDNYSFGRNSPANENLKKLNFPVVKVSSINFEGIPYQTKFIVSKSMMNPIANPNINPKRLAQIQQLQQQVKHPKINEFPIVKECQVVRKKRSESVRNSELEEQIKQSQQDAQKTNQIDIFSVKANSNISHYNNMSFQQGFGGSASVVMSPNQNGNGSKNKNDNQYSSIQYDFQESYSRISYKRVQDSMQNPGQTLSQLNSSRNQNINLLNGDQINSQINTSNNFSSSKYGKPILNKQHPLLQIGTKQNNSEMLLPVANSKSTSRIIKKSQQSINNSQLQPHHHNHRSLRNSPERSEFIEIGDDKYNTLHLLKERTPLQQLHNKPNNFIKDVPFIELSSSRADADANANATPPNENESNQNKPDQQQQQLNLDSEINLTHRTHLKHLDQKSIAKKIHTYKKYINQLEGILQEREKEDKKDFFSNKKNKSITQHPLHQNHLIESEVFKANKSIFFEKTRPTSSVIVGRNGSYGGKNASKNLNGKQAQILQNKFLNNNFNSDFLQPSKNSSLYHGLDLEKKESETANQKPNYLQRQRFAPLKPQTTAASGSTEGRVDDILYKRNSLNNVQSINGKQEIYNSIYAPAIPSILFDESNSINKSVDFIQQNRSRSSNKFDKDNINLSGFGKEGGVAQVQKKQLQIRDQIKSARQHIQDILQKRKSKEYIFNNNSCFVQDSDFHHKQQDINIKEINDFKRKISFDKTAAFAMHE